MEINLNHIREQFPVTKTCAYLNHAAASPLSLRATDAIRELMDDQLCHGYCNGDRWKEHYSQVRGMGAQLLHTRPERIAFIKSTSEGLGFAANGVNWHEGDNVVLPANEFPTNYNPWLNLSVRGVSLQTVPPRPDRTIPVEDIRQCIDSHTHVVAISFVQYYSGFRADLAAIGQLCRERDLLFVVDGIQGVGALDLDAEACGADIIAADGHKFLLAPFSVGLMYVSPRALEHLSVSVVGWLSVNDPFNFRPVLDLLPDARRFEPGTENNLGIYGLGGALELFLETGMANVEGRIHSLTGLLNEGLLRKGYRVLSPREKSFQSAILVFNHPTQRNEAIKQRFDAENIIVSIRGGGIRVSPHFYNSEEEIEHLLSTLV
ncbi:cysteine desulfurase / selenocysteine lyase [Anaerolineales bacterium]|nr:cysteine desulfurase / selenocysteine lyase [Anaerolineales bacterium]